MRQVRTYRLGRPEPGYLAPHAGAGTLRRLGVTQDRYTWPCYASMGSCAGVGWPYREKARLIRLSLLGTILIARKHPFLMSTEGGT